MKVDDFPKFKLGEFLQGTQIEVRERVPRGTIRSALFDFDGTVSLIRRGWQDVMVRMMVEILRKYMKEGENLNELARHVFDYVDRLTGRQTIYQMFQLTEEIKRRGGEPLEPLEYKHIYHERLREHISSRIEGLRSGTISPDELTMPGARALLEGLQERGVTLYLASGTDLVYVREEAELLGVVKYFDGGIYGALERVEDFSKAAVIQKMFREHRLEGPELVSFGDGYVEILNTKEVGGIAVGVASDEVEGLRVNQWKRNRLIQAGADLIIPGYQEQEPLLAYLFN
ncbi:HAD family hydrolase [Acidobacteria bacterium AH-259-L09]|nr:HAD family hydrolase [Acidobacteria bacterium AH-259-L09]